LYASKKERAINRTIHRTMPPKRIKQSNKQNNASTKKKKRARNRTIMIATGEACAGRFSHTFVVCC
jgi:hypothetical protein